MAVTGRAGENCRILYGNDRVSVSIRKEEIIKSYFKNEDPDVTVLEPPGSYAEYKNMLEGQSLFSSKMAVVIEDPFFLKRKLSNKKEETAFQDFILLLKNLSSDVLVIFTVFDVLDKRIKTVKEILLVCKGEECSLMKPENGASFMVQLLMKEGKRVEPEARMYLEEVLRAWEVLSKPLLQTECDKIVLMAGEKQSISRKLLEAALPDYMDQGIFRFTDSLLDKKASVILESAEKVFRNPEETIKSVGYLASRFRKIKMLKEMQRNKVPVLKMQKMLDIKNHYGLDYLVKDAKKVTEEEAEWFLLELFDYQFDLRFKGNDGLKDLLLKYCLRK